ncbi:creatininase [Citricoccus sp. I39-566]|uniref:creatininase n=1 Tax=Citricoccus sp. I39-566 TaxID=3073268 RepID=UPI00286CC199|nr:creatininase [Citricoccus sp. I39-566]WMY79296.1 creatininase [Citricoccus sp. I39-566]
MTSIPGIPAAAQSTRLAHLDAHTYRDWAAGEHSTVLLPAGAFEQHGPHLPLGTDAILSTAIAEAVGSRIGAKVAEPLSYGYKSQQKSGGGDHLPGTVSLDAAALIGQARCIMAGFLAQGIRNLVVLNGHYENYQFLYEAADLALADAGAGHGHGHGPQPTVLLLSYWDYVTEGTLATVYPDGFPGWDIEHGGVLETSLMLHLRPELVALDRAVSHPPAALPRFDRLPVVASRTPDTGCLSAPDGSDERKGALLFEQVTAELSGDVATELRLPG